MQDILAFVVSITALFAFANAMPPIVGIVVFALIVAMMMKHAPGKK